MKKLLILPFILACGTATADETAYELQFHRAEEIQAAGGFTHKAAASFAYQWDRSITLQADTAISRFSDGTSNDSSVGFHASYNISPELRIGAYAGLENINFDANDYVFYGFEFDYSIESGSISVFGGQNGNDGIPVNDNVAYGAEIRIPASDALTLVGRGLMRDNDALDVFTTIVGAGIEYELPNGVALSGELAKWDRKQAWVAYDDGLSISLGAKMTVDRNGILFRQRNSVTNTFGSEFTFP